MAETSSIPQQGLSLSKPPLFNGPNYMYWKKRMEVYMKAKDLDLWEVVVQGPKILTKEKLDESDKKVLQLNATAMHILHCACPCDKVFDHIATCETAKEIWDKLQMVYEGSRRVKQLKVTRLEGKYDSFKMQPNESVSDMISRFSEIINGLQDLGESYPDSKLVWKLIRSIPWRIRRPIVAVIGEERDLDTLSFDELISYFMFYEQWMEPELRK